MSTSLIEKLNYEELIGSLGSYSMGLAAANSSDYDQMLTPDGHINTEGLEVFNTDYVKGFVDGVLEEFPHARVKEKQRA